MSATGVVSGSSYQIWGELFAFGAINTGSAYFGFAGNTTNTGGANTGSGSGALAHDTTGTNDTANGSDALNSNTTGNNNTAAGVAALYDNTTGYENTASGAFALSYSTTGSLNTASGYTALALNTTGAENTASGVGALYSNTTGNYNTATGVSALGYNGASSYNTGDGYEALVSSTGYYDTAGGYQALYSNTTGGLNVADGVQALYDNTTGSENTAVGFYALGSNTTGNYLTCIGYDCNTADGLSNATAIGSFATVGESNALVLGGTGDHAVKVGIGTTTPSNILTIARGAGHPVSDSWETYSSRRWKTNIQTLPDALGKVERLRGVSYDLKDSGRHEIGVIAEEVGSVIPEVVTYEDDGTDARGVDYGRLTALLIEATKQQQALIYKQQEQITRLTAQVRTIRKSLNMNHHITRSRTIQRLSTN